jgi:uncharacterized integral membrane protein (TIGR00698 family)
MNKQITKINYFKLATDTLPGLLIALVIAVFSFVTWWFLQDTWLKFSALLWAFIYSIIASNLIPAISKDKFKPGVEFASKSLLQGSIALFGLTFSASVWVKMGFWGIAVVLINLILAMTFGMLFCRYVLKINNTLSIIISVGTCICGSTAIAAIGPTLRAKSEEIGLSLAVITLFGLIAMFAYPELFNGPLGTWLNNDPSAYGMWTGIGIHETAQVIAASSEVSGASAIALSAKFIRIFMIGPMIFVSLLLFRQFSRTSSSEPIKIAIPWFASAFIIFTLVHLGLENSPASEWWVTFNSSFLKPAVTFLLAWSFAGVGLKVKLASIMTVGLKVFLGGLVVAIFAGISGLLLVKFIWLQPPW